MYILLKADNIENLNQAKKYIIPRVNVLFVAEDYIGEVIGETIRGIFYNCNWPGHISHETSINWRQGVWTNDHSDVKWSRLTGINRLTLISIYETLFQGNARLIETEETDGDQPEGSFTLTYCSKSDPNSFTYITFEPEPQEEMPTEH